MDKEYNEIFHQKKLRVVYESSDYVNPVTINAQPDLLIVGASIAKYSFLNDHHLPYLLKI
jgi:hypothetical protein